MRDGVIPHAATAEEHADSYAPPQVLVITGPTATGKTELGVRLALELNGEVVSADSMQIYRGLDIGTAKPDLREMRGVAHHMLDVAAANESYSVARYIRQSAGCIDGILRRGRLPIIVGGTGLYIDSLLRGGGFAPAPEDRELRSALERDYDALGGEILLRRLRDADPERAEKLAAADKRRIVRALEVFVLTGRTLTSFDRESREVPPRYNASIWALNYTEREMLYNRIDSRVDNMLLRGLEDEVKRLRDSGLSRDSTAGQAIGYKEILSALDGEIDMDAAVGLIKQESRRYAKRQLTWLRRTPELKWILWNNLPQNYDFSDAIYKIRQNLAFDFC